MGSPSKATDQDLMVPDSSPSNSNLKVGLNLPVCLLGSRDGKVPILPKGSFTQGAFDTWMLLVQLI